MPKRKVIGPSEKSIKIRVRCWVEVDGVKFFGPGPAELLQRIIDYGSITKAAKSMDMSYKKAWALIDDINRMASKPFVITNKGGRLGGGTEVTPAGKKAMADFKKLNKKIASIIRAERALMTI
jgi:molybdate transport system regulatory protein